MNLLPNKVFLKAYHKKPLKTLEEDLDMENNYNIDFDNGAIY